MVPAVVPSFEALSNILLNEDECFAFLMEKGILFSDRMCTCGGALRYYETRKGFRCSSRDCRKSISVFHGSFFAKCILPIHKVLHLGYLWLCKCSVSFAIAYTGHSSATICSYFNYFRQLVADSLDELDFCIGGAGVEVELDESKFGKRKYNRGHAVEGVWVLGGVERTPERKLFLVAVPDRSQATLEGVISRHVLPGSIILTDLWKGYSGLSQHFDYTHQSVNHSLQFIDPETGTHTNTIEGTWSGVKVGIPKRNRVAGEIDDHLFEFIWRRTNASDLWGAFLHALHEVSYE